MTRIYYLSDSITTVSDERTFYKSDYLVNDKKIKIERWYY